MMRGVAFDIDQTFESQIFSMILGEFAEDYTWYLVDEQSEIWADDSGTEFFRQSAYEGVRFKEKIEEGHYAIFAKLQAYYSEDDFVQIHTYADFLQSTCQILFLINDAQYVEIYIKSPEILEKVYQRAIENSFQNIKYITAENDMRRRMDFF